MRPSYDTSTVQQVERQTKDHETNKPHDKRELHTHNEALVKVCGVGVGLAQGANLP
jgi:hypothetical protein